MTPTVAASLLLLTHLGGCTREQDVLVTDVQTDDASLEPSLRFAYFREDPSRNRLHLRFTDYWNPCVADAQLQNQIRRNPAPRDQAAAYQSILPRRNWTADVYLTLDTWPDSNQTDRSFDVIPQQSPDGATANFGVVCLLRQCPYETQCDRCLPAGPGAVAGFSRTTSPLDAEYFENSFADNRVQQFASSGTVELRRWRLATPTDSPEDSGFETTLDPDAFVRGTARFTLREVGQDTDAGEVELDFAAFVCEPMQAAFTSDIADFDRRDLNPYGPPACQVGSPAPYAWWVAGLGLLARRRKRTSSGTSDSAEADTGDTEQP